MEKENIEKKYICKAGSDNDSIRPCSKIEGMSCERCSFGQEVKAKTIEEAKKDVMLGMARKEDFETIIDNNECSVKALIGTPIAIWHNKREETYKVVCGHTQICTTQDTEEKAIAEINKPTYKRICEIAYAIAKEAIDFVETERAIHSQGLSSLS